MITASVAQGADLACISGDKLLGGPGRHLTGKPDAVAASAATPCSAPSP